MNNFKKATVICLLCILQHPPALHSQISDNRMPDGAIEMEELDESEAQRLSDLKEHPIRINTASKARLAECGLFTQFQVASLIDYRTHSGDILSYTEMASLDGFDERYVSVIREYVELSSKAAPGHSSTERKKSGSITVRGTIKKDAGAGLQCGYAVKGRFDAAGSFTLNAGIRGGGWSVGATYYGRSHLDKLVAGDFNARFGQGLTMWSGFSLSGLSSCDSFCRKPTGIAASSSYSGAYSLRGAAAQFSWGGTTLACFASLDGLCGANAHWTGRKSGFGLTACIARDYRRIGTDAAFSAGRFDFWGEAAWDLTSRRPAGTAGMRWNIDYGKSLVLLARGYPSGLADAYSGAVRASTKASGEYGFSAGMQFLGISSTLDAAMMASKGFWQIKSITVWDIPAGERTSLRLRSSLRLRPGEVQPVKLDLRGDMHFSAGAWKFNVRANYMHCTGNAVLGYAECGFISDKLSLWMRTTAFAIDNWDDRIYCYERDGPGSFNVPAYYGRGAGICAFAVWKKGRSSIYARVSATGYINSKPGRVDCRVQYTVRL